eukprot:699182-Pelagomonas_calceolata.AAC.3
MSSALLGWHLRHPKPWRRYAGKQLQHQSQVLFKRSMLCKCRDPLLQRTCSSSTPVSHAHPLNSAGTIVAIGA